jgi:serine/threonine protein kinase
MLPQPPYARKSGDYKCLAVLGKGTYGICYKVIARSGGEICVMKVIPLVGLGSKDVNTATSEATLLSTIKHPHIVGYLDAWVENGHLYIVMEYCAGGDVAARLRTTGTMSNDHIWRFARDVTCGLEFLHHRRIMHRFETHLLRSHSLDFVPHLAQHGIPLGDSGFL